MQSLFWGLFFIFLDFNVTLGNSVVGLIPDFVGYILLIGAMRELASQSPQFENVGRWTLPMAIVTGIFYALDAFGISTSLYPLSVLAGIVSSIISFYLTYLIILGIKDIEQTRQTNLGSEKLLLYWKLLIAGIVASYLSLIITPIAVIMIVFSLICSILFLYHLSQTKNMYQTLGLY